MSDTASPSATHFFTHPIFLEHVTPPGHPERIDRLNVVNDILAHEEFNALVRKTPLRAESDRVYLAHPPHFFERVAGMVPLEGMSQVDSDTIISPKSLEAALTAVGAATNAVDAVAKGEAQNAFVAARPPGHHAEKDRAMGFCLFNSVAIAARHAQQTYGYERIAIVDFDVHHGNGTQDIFWDDPSVLFCSSHQMPLYPGSGALSETGAGNAGNIVNAPLLEGTQTNGFKEAYETRIFPQIQAFKPDMILISAGFDAHYRDPLAGLKLVENDFDWVTGRLMDIADSLCDGRVVSMLEGGYDLLGLSRSVRAHILRLMGKTELEL